MDIVILLIIVLLIAIISKKFSNTVIFLGLIDILLRIISFIGNNTTREIKVFTSKYFPSSIESLIITNSSGILETILVWIYVSIMALFVYYVFKTLLHRM